MSRQLNSRDTSNSKFNRLKDTPMAFRILIIDTETTGLPKNRRADVTDLSNWPVPVQIGWVMYKCPHAGKPGRVLRKGNMIVRPAGWDIPAESTAIHGISMEYATKNGRFLHECMLDLAGVINQAQAVCCHNAEFDIPVLLSAVHRCGMNVRLYPLNDRPVICTMEVGRPICNILMEVKGAHGPRFKLKPPRLGELYEKLFGSPFKGRLHDATEDCRATAEILGVLMEKYLPFVRVNCPELFRLKNPPSFLHSEDTDDDILHMPEITIVD